MTKNNTTVDLIGITQKIDFTLIKFRNCPIKIFFEGSEIDPFLFMMIKDEFVKDIEDEEW